MVKRQGKSYVEEKPVKTAKRVLLKEIILENFMSYAYARIPLQAGLNVICGPNGSGKSSILLALSVALGQAYTERSRRLSDLIRRGEKIARTTLLFDNSPINGRRPISNCQSDIFMLSRYLRSDGTYWYEAEYREITKSEVTRILDNLGINPENMLIIMHQNMVEEFSIVSPYQKLVLLEEAIGFQNYRQRILEARERLSQVLSEESSISSLLSNAEQTLRYWQEQYGRYRRKMELTEQKMLLERELAWASVSKMKRDLEKLQNDRRQRESELTFVHRDAENVKKDINETFRNISRLKSILNETVNSLIECEKEKSRCETYIEFSRDIDEKIGKYFSNQKRESEIGLWLDKIKTQAKKLESKIEDLNRQISDFKLKISNDEGKIESATERYISEKIKEAILNFQKGSFEEKINQLETEIKQLAKEIKEQTSKAEKVGPELDTQRTVQEISDDLKIVNIQLNTAENVSEDTEKMYRKYKKTYEELKQKLEVVSENKHRLLAEVEVRKQTWKKVLGDFIKDLNETYKSTLSMVGAEGEIKLVGLEDVETAGLNMSVGYNNQPPVTLDAYTQSGGERTTAVMAFLLSLQKYVKSPIRAVDEFDVHMDPRNRELISKLISSTVKEKGDIQYIVITPGQLPFFDEETQIFMVQNVKGRSEVKLVT
ncbi:MAG: AAA family ATPase [Candidatus Bathyarchaeia archaeon]